MHLLTSESNWKWLSLSKSSGFSFCHFFHYPTWTYISLNITKWFLIITNNDRSNEMCGSVNFSLDPASSVRVVRRIYKHITHAYSFQISHRITKKTMVLVSKCGTAHTQCVPCLYTIGCPLFSPTPVARMRFSFLFNLPYKSAVQFFFISDSCIWHLFEMAVDKSKEFGRCIDTSCRAYYQNSEKQTQIRKVWNKIGINHKARTLNRQKWHSYNHKQGTKKSVVQRLFNADLRWV